MKKIVTSQVNWLKIQEASNTSECPVNEQDLLTYLKMFGYLTQNGLPTVRALNSDVLALRTMNTITGSAREQQESKEILISESFLTLYKRMYISGAVEQIASEYEAQIGTL